MKMHGSDSEMIAEVPYGDVCRKMVAKPKFTDVSEQNKLSSQNGKRY